MPIIQSTFEPNALLSSPHLQTVLASKFIKPSTPAVSQRERIELPDGDFLDINISPVEHSDIVVLFHGLAGGIGSSYAQGAFNTLSAQGFRPVLMHWRGCSGEPNRLARSYHSGASDDIAWIIHYLGKRFPHARLFALGYSLGANALLKYLGEAGTTSPLTGAMAVSPPLVLKEAAIRLNQGFARVYQRHLLSEMRDHHEAKRRRYPELHLPAAKSDLDTFWKFDDTVTAPLHGFDGADDYYTRCSARQFLPGIMTPTHILNARDDPFFTPKILPQAQELSANTTLEIAENGGHVGFLLGRTRWLDFHVANTLANFRSAST